MLCTVCVYVCEVYLIHLIYLILFSSDIQTIELTKETSLFLSDFYTIRRHRFDTSLIGGNGQHGVYRCPNINCTKFFNWKGNLARHLRYECGLEPRFKCPYCRYRCKVKADVSKHIVRRHKDCAVYVLDMFHFHTEQG